MLDRKLSLVLPAHNEAENIEAIVMRALDVLPRLIRDIEIIVVNDGSRDETGPIIDTLASRHACVHAVHHPHNRGYGAALTSGFRVATGDSIMFMDSDRQFDIADINALLPYVPYYDIVAGYRIQRRDPLYRRLYGKMFGLVVWLLFGVHLRDTDCAFKIYRADLLNSIELTTPGALINTEMLARAKRRGATIVEVGVNHYPRFAGESSGGSPSVVFRAMGETVKLWLRLRRESAGDPAPPNGHNERRALVRPRTVVTAVFGAVAALVALVSRKRRSS
ncbi:MAG: glycosyltransferase family 2 protein [Thermomicrobiales bacterium]